MCLLTHWDGLWLPTGEIIASTDTDIIGKTSNQIWSISLVQKNSMVDIWCSINAHIDTPITAWNSVVGDTVCVTACLSFLQWNKFSVGALVIRLVNYGQLQVRRPWELGYGKPRYCLADPIYYVTAAMETGYVLHRFTNFGMLHTTVIWDGVL